jgi:hypothetical protein
VALLGLTPLLFQYAHHKTWEPEGTQAGRGAANPPEPPVLCPIWGTIPRTSLIPL